MTGQRLEKCIALCLLPWSCLSVARNSAAGPAAEHIGKRLPRDFANGTYEHSNISAQCTALPPPRHGHYYVDRGSGVSVGSVIVYWCEEGYRLASLLIAGGLDQVTLKGPFQLKRFSDSVISSASGTLDPGPPGTRSSRSAPGLSVPRRAAAQRRALPLPAAVPPPADTGSRLAVAAALVSGAVILALAASFAVCCWRERARRSRGLGPGNGGRRQPGRKPRAGRTGDGWAAQRGRKAFGRLKHHHRRDYHLSALSSSVFPGPFAGCNNVAFQRSPDRLPQRGSQPGAWLWPQPASQPHAAPRSSPSRRPRCLQLPPGQGRIDRPRVLLPGCYRSYAEHKLSDTCGRPV
ncbi:uncharacterized protein LOC110397713 [Numida meleagris]|uniref:uncharacterized protein LOC110397713 n=1 Tax=Numida meleagris TaxID=8996 RepID=UPI000B3E0113|nr:uncharacterized protein LOC110397713 [Numida meleagris]